MTTPVTQAHLERAFALARRPDWRETSLAELMAAAQHVALVEGLAKRLASGLGTTLRDDPTALADQPPPGPVPLRCWDYPTRRAGHNPHAQPSPHRRRTDGLDGKSLAAGERDDD